MSSYSNERVVPLQAQATNSRIRASVKTCRSHCTASHTLQSPSRVRPRSLTLSRRADDGNHRTRSRYILLFLSFSHSRSRSMSHRGEKFIVERLMHARARDERRRNGKEGERERKRETRRRRACKYTSRYEACKYYIGTSLARVHAIRETLINQ